MISSVYVINLEKDVKRWLEMKKTLIDVGINDYNRIEGVYGKELSELDLKKNTTESCNKYCTKSMIGCAMSHLKTWETVLKNNDKTALILEDDVMLPNDFKYKINKYMKQVPDNYDIVYVGCLGCEYKKRSKTITTFLLGFNGLQEREHSIISENVYIPNFPLALHCYIISYKGAKKLINIVKNKINGHVDLQLNLKGLELNVYAINPQLAYQKVSTNNSNNTTSYPILINKVIDNFIDENGLPFSYCLSINIFHYKGIDINAYFIIYGVMGFFIGKYYGYNTWLSVFLCYNILELYLEPNNLTIIIQLLITSSIFSYIGNKL
jgi:GR25 family glycosyltransferase involved in LPS biosynthesis